MIKVYGRANSINVRKVLWMCEEVGEKFTREDYGRGFKPTSDGQAVPQAIEFKIQRNARLTQIGRGTGNLPGHLL